MGSGTKLNRVASTIMTLLIHGYKNVRLIYLLIYDNITSVKSFLNSNLSLINYNQFKKVAAASMLVNSIDVT